MAIRSGIPVAAWLAEEDPRILPTAFDLISQQSQAPDARGPQMSG